MSRANPQLITIFNEALDQNDPVARAAYLDRACGGGLRPCSPRMTAPGDSSNRRRLLSMH